MNLIEKLIEAEIEKCKDVLRIYHEPENSNPAQVFIDASDHLTDLRNALQEYREMCKREYRANPSSPISPLKNPD